MPINIDLLRAAMPGLTIPDQRPIEGGQRIVFLASDESGVRSAIKILKEPLRLGEEDEFTQAENQAVERYRREVETLRQIRSSNVVRILDEPQPIELGGDTYLVHIEPFFDQSLASRLQAQQLATPQECSRFLKDLFNALTDLDQSGIVHRDIKPPNVMFAADGTAILVDFGIAFLSNRTRVTQTAVPSPYSWLYFAPEQMDATLNPDGRADQFLVALSAFVFVTGSHPFVAADIPGYFEAVKAGIDQKQLTDAGLDPRLAAFIARCLGARPNQRFRTPALAMEELQACLGAAT